MSTFDDFWEAYPRKQSKADAAKSWKKINPTESLRAKIMAAIEIQKKSRQWQDHIIPHPSTWLNQERWNDEMEINLKPKLDPAKSKEALERYEKLKERYGIIRFEPKQKSGNA